MENAAFLEPSKDDLLEAMLEFFEEHVQQRFPETDYTYDVYVTTAGKVGNNRSPAPLECWHALPCCLVILQSCGHPCMSSLWIFACCLCLI